MKRKELSAGNAGVPTLGKTAVKQEDADVDALEKEEIDAFSYALKI